MSETGRPYGREASLTEAERRAEPRLPEPPRSAMEERPKARYRVSPAARLFVRGPWEMAATALIAAGVVMLMQPFSMWLYGWSFAVILTGTLMFLIVSHFPSGE